MVKKEWKDLKIVVAGAGTGGLSTCRVLFNFNPKYIILPKNGGIINDGRPELNPKVGKMANLSNKYKLKGNLTEAIKNANIFIGLSTSNVLTIKMVKSMAKDAIVFALANPDPEIMTEDAFAGGVRIVATGRPEFPNHINNELVFPGLFRIQRSFDGKSFKYCWRYESRRASRALTSLVSSRELNEKFVIPDVFDKRCAKVITDSLKNILFF